MNFVSDGNFQVTEVTNLGVADPSVVDMFMGEALSLREYWKGDFTALTPPSDEKGAIVAYTLHLE